jgi:hypothetical protein
MEISVFLTYKEVLNYLHNQGEDAPTNENYDANIQIYTKAAHDKICRYLGYEIIDTDYKNEYYDGTGSNRLYLNNRPITTVAHLYEDDEEISSTDFIVFDNHILLKDGRFTPGTANYKVEYSAGWTKAKMPFDLKLAGLQLVELAANNVGRVGKATISAGQTSENVDFDAETRILKSIDTYRGFNTL